MGNENITNCDGCKKDFLIVMQDRTHAAQTTEHYFTCPHCQTDYTAYVTDPFILKEQKELRKLNERYLKKKSALSVYMQKKKMEVQEHD